MLRITMPTLRCYTNTLTRNRDKPWIEIAKLHSISLANSVRYSSFISECASTRVTASVSFYEMSGYIWTWAFMLGGKSAEINRSEPFCALVVASSLAYRRGLGRQ
jgi:hypothetical protein